MKKNTNESKIKLNDNVFGYNAKQILHLNEMDSVFYLLEHKKTGAQHIHIENKDNENTFGVAFKTVPFNSKGVAHILEHTVLCGSRNFPVRDPFFSMIKRSLSTFMNAFTSPDWTMYPFSTQNKKDYYNLMNVYMDSVFFPKIHELSFKQEGCRIDFENPKTENTLVYKGIVYNEMKGSVSSPDQVMMRSLLNALYPDTTYSNNSGGSPTEIPSLTHNELKKFHGKYYHPSNSFFYTYGNLSLNNHLKHINEKFLSHFSYIEINADIPNQPRWKKTKNVCYHYPLSKSENSEKKNQICVAWLTADVKDTFEVLVLSILEQILLGNDASPLRKALIDSNLGTSLSDGTGFDAENRDTLFTCGLKDVKKSDCEKIENIILEKLDSLAKKGIDQVIIDSALHKIELHIKERTNIPYPFGIKLFMSISACWLHKGKPWKILSFNKNMNKIKRCISNGNFFENKIEEYFVENKHRVLLILSPDHDMARKENKRIRDELLKIRSNMNESDLNKIRSDAAKLSKLRQESEDLSCLPTLLLEDIPSSITRIEAPLSISKTHDILNYKQSTSGLLYFYGLIGVGSLETNILTLVPFFCHVLPRMGTKLHKHTKISQDIDLYTGGINLTPHSITMFNSNGTCVPFISYNSKCLTRNKDKMIELINETINQIDFDDSNRIIQLLLEYKSGIESIIVRNGHSLAISLASRNFSNASHLSEMWSGIAQLQTVRNILSSIDTGSVKSLINKLHHIAKSIFFKKNLKIALIGEKSDLYSAQRNIDTFSQSVPPNKKTCFKPVNFNLEPKYFFEGWATSTSVSFVAQTFETAKMEHEDSPALSVISRIIHSMYLHKEIREKGGAYGGFSIYNSENGLLSFCSYRDPHVIKTLNVYNGVYDFILLNKIRDAYIKEAILEICSEIDKPDSPAIQAKKDFFRRTIGLSDDIRQLYKDNLLNVKKKHILNVTEKYFSPSYSNKSVAIISNEELLNKVNKEHYKSTLNVRTI